MNKENDEAKAFSDFSRRQSEQFPNLISMDKLSAPPKPEVSEEEKMYSIWYDSVKLKLPTTDRRSVALAAWFAALAWRESVNKS